MSAIVQQFEHSLALAFFGIGKKTDIFQVATAEFSKFADIFSAAYLNGLVVFPTFFDLSLTLALRSSWSEVFQDSYGTQAPIIDLYIHMLFNSDQSDYKGKALGY